ncbi:MAG: MBL fold metallo-hydrolase, partial [Bacteroidota bacterium]
MNIQRITTEGLSHHSYFVSDGGEALVIDPRRDVDLYLELAARNEAKIRRVFETHRHEDFAVGSCELAARTGATILHGKAIPFAYGEGIAEGFECAVGRWRLRTLQTPGHTAESLTYILSDREYPNAPLLVFSGDALFVGEVGRVDLYGADCREHLAGALHDSLFEKILPLGDGVILAPAHGGGSVCGANISPRSESTLGFERLHNPRLLPDREQFIQEKCKERLVVPRYFRRMEEYNLQGAPLLGRLPNLEPLSVERFSEEIREGALVVDTRMPQAFAGGHIPGAYSIWLEGLSGYAGWVLPLDHPLLLVLEPGTSSERVARMLVRVGYENLRGMLRGGFESWQNAGKPWERIPTLGPEEARERLEKGA